MAGRGMSRTGGRGLTNVKETKGNWVIYQTLPNPTIMGPKIVALMPREGVAHYLCIPESSPAYMLKVWSIILMPHKGGLPAYVG